MEIQNSTIDDLEFIFDLYRSATAYQKERFISHWPEFDRDMVINEIAEKRQWKLIIEGEIVCIWATTFSDPLIWLDKDAPLPGAVAERSGRRSRMEARRSLRVRHRTARSPGCRSGRTFPVRDSR